MSRIRFGDRTIALPANRLVRMTLGLALVIGGLLGFLPVLGFWMVPLGLIVLSHDIPAVRRMRRRLAVRLGDWLKPRWPRLAAMLGFNGQVALRKTEAANGARTDPPG